MKGLDVAFSSRVGEPRTALPRQAPGDDFPACLAEAIDILADRAKRHGLVEVVHLLDVAAMAARDVAVEPANDHGQT